jgi:hypothetical protein
MHMARNNFRKLQRRKYIAAEITNTEKTYVDGLRSVVDVSSRRLLNMAMEE